MTITVDGPARMVRASAATVGEITYPPAHACGRAARPVEPGPSRHASPAAGRTVRAMRLSVRRGGEPLPYAGERLHA
ncbi:hypothetical protein GR925_25390 [Streptomyces sp. HUCO-GS316]|uniref:hypothetical protein n=1 Tax=Streptomyces sp. HUCO-GS316 TaxID=2692198 RepID=UPI00136F323F|nr:hypothetical protein [Streptomyces sp. HUCO-GS316]MXM66673.1 hypothetical protein [Streptomyces sp. HUCO-GS316]